MKTKPIAVLVSDVHYCLKHLELADKSMHMAIDKANTLGVSLIVAGDLHDTKANLRGECVNAMLETFKEVETVAYVLVGNHDKINEKSIDNSLNFLAAGHTIVLSGPCKIPGKFNLIPYQHDIEEFKKALIPRYINIVHQGITGSNSGGYIQDKTAITKADVAGLRIISGHYHARQTIDLPNEGKWDYIGNPYTQNFAEANDPEKGFQILYDDGSLEFVPTNLRKHVVYEGLNGPRKHTDQDLIWVKVKGVKEELKTITKESVSRDCGVIQPFKLDLIATDEEPKAIKTQGLSKPEILDGIIDSLAIDLERKTVIKDMWRSKV